MISFQWCNYQKYWMYNSQKSPVLGGPEISSDITFVPYNISTIICNTIIHILCYFFNNFNVIIINNNISLDIFTWVPYHKVAPLFPSLHTPFRKKKSVFHLILFEYPSSPTKRNILISLSITHSILIEF
jgi:hypothetical protein